MAGQQTQMPTRQRTEEDVAPRLDPSGTIDLLLERLQAWKHLCVYLEDYISEVAKDQIKQAKDQERILKTVSNPIAEAHHFDQSAGGVTTLFEHIRVNIQSHANLHTETSQNLTGNVLPMLERLHAEIKDKSKEVGSGANKGSKSVDKSRVATQRQIELLGQHIATVESMGGRVDAPNDPYVLHRGLYYRLNKQILEENGHRQEMLSVQDSFQQFEAHVITTVQATLNTFQQFMSGQVDRQKALYGDITATAQKIPPDFEWNGFLHRYSDKLINPNAPPRSINNVNFPNQNHRATQPLIHGTLERKARGSLGALKGYSSGYYVVTVAGYLHEYKDEANLDRDSLPETSLYLPDCTISAVDGNEFTVRGKDQSHGKLGSKFATTGEFKFRADSSRDAQRWYQVIIQQARNATNASPTSPVDGRNDDGQQQQQQRVDPTVVESKDVGSQQPQETIGSVTTEGKNVSDQQQPPQQTTYPTAMENQGVSRQQQQQQPHTMGSAATEKPREAGFAGGSVPEPTHINTAAAPQQRSVPSSQSMTYKSEKLISPLSATGGQVAPSGAGSHFHSRTGGTK